MADLKQTTINDTGFLRLPTGTTAQRPGSPADGQIRFNTDTLAAEWYDSEYNSWFPISYIPPIATGGTVTNITQGGANYQVHTFTAVGTNTLTVSRSGTVEFLIVAGGGGGGMDMGGGGGGGGVLLGETTVTPQTYTITVGAGGWGAPAGGGGFRGDGVGPQPNAHQFTIGATNGENSSALGFTAIGGGFGGSSPYSFTPGAAGGSGGSGGGVSGYNNTRTFLPGGSGTPGQGNKGGDAIANIRYYSGGGGGAGAPGVNAPAVPNGGIGVSSNILGTNYFWGGGGGGSAYSVSPGGNGGIGGGGGGAVGTTFGGAGLNNGSGGGGGSPNSQTNRPGGNAGANTGGGGGGGSHYNRTNQGGNGGSGIVVIRYRIS